MPKGIYKRTSEMKSGKWKRTIEHNKKNSLALKKAGIKPPSRLGIKMTEEQKEKIRKANKGKNNWSKGKNHPNWKGGISNIKDRIMVGQKYKEWRQQIFIRDNFICQKCKIIGGHLEAHHIKPFNKLLEEVKKYLPLFNLYDGAMIYTPLWNIDNGKTLCKDCHRKIHRRKNEKRFYRQ